MEYRQLSKEDCIQGADMRLKAFAERLEEVKKHIVMVDADKPSHNDLIKLRIDLNHNRAD